MSRVVVLAAVGAVLLAGCAAATGAAPSNSVAANQWVDQQVSFDAGGVTVYATYRHPMVQTTPVSAALIIAGSGPSDRDGNSPGLAGPIDNLKALAEWLSADGVASVRYDKLGSGKTGLGPFAGRPNSIGVLPFQQEAAAALTFLAAQPGVDRARLAVFGHSEGALFALLLASGSAGPVPPIRALGLLEPLGLRYLDLLTVQINGQSDAALRAGQLTPEQATAVKSALASTVQQVRASGTVPADLPSGLGRIFNSGTALFLMEADRSDPGQLASALPAHIAVLVTCSDSDVQVTCEQVGHITAGLKEGSANIDLVQLTGVDHVLKQDPSGTPANYTKRLPFSPQLRDGIRAFVERGL